MALETSCVQVSNIASTRACMLHARLLASKEKIRLSTCRGLKIPTLSLSTSALSSSPCFAPSIARRSYSSHVVCKAQNAVDEVLVVTDKSWNDQVVGSETPVLVDFWAPWCGPCRMIAPIIDELAKQYAGKIVCYKLNTDDCPTIATQYGIRSIPTVLVFKNGEKKETIVGAVPKSTLTATIEKYLDG